MFNFREFVEDTTAAKLGVPFCGGTYLGAFGSDCCLIPHWWCAAGTNFFKDTGHTGFPALYRG